MSAEDRAAIGLWNPLAHDAPILDVIQDQEPVAVEREPTLADGGGAGDVGVVAAGEFQSLSEGGKTGERL